MLRCRSRMIRAFGSGFKRSGGTFELELELDKWELTS